MFTILSLIFLANICHQQKLHIDWSDYLAESDTSIRLSNRKLENTHGLSDYLFIKSLQLNQNGLKEIGEIKYLVNLEELDLDDNFLESIDDLRCLKRLSTLSLKNNRIKSLRGIENLSNLSNIKIDINVIESLDELKLLKNLKGIWASSNRITSLQGIQTLNQLVSLYFVLSIFRIKIQDFVIKKMKRKSLRLLIF